LAPDNGKTPSHRIAATTTETKTRVGFIENFLNL
jgi:hypothetical protein